MAKMAAKTQKNTGETARMAELAEVWQKIQQNFPEANLFQSPAWGEAQRRQGNRVIVKHFGDAAWCQMVVCDARRGRYLEISCGPLLDWNDRALVRRMFMVIRQVAKQEKCVFVRMRPQVLASESEKLSGLKLRRAPMHLAAEHTVMIDLTRSEDEILASFRRQTRYEVRRAAKLDIVVTKGNSEKLFREFQQAQAKTAARQHFIPPKLGTLLAEREALGQNAQIYVASTAPAKDSGRGTTAPVEPAETSAAFEKKSKDLTASAPAKFTKDSKKKVKEFTASTPADSAEVSVKKSKNLAALAKKSDNLIVPEGSAVTSEKSKTSASTKQSTKNPEVSKSEKSGEKLVNQTKDVQPGHDSADFPADQPIAYGLILIGENEADYYEAASTELHRHLPGAYALQWQVIRDLRKLGIQRYNLWGIAPPDQPNHRYAGVTTFKTGFGEVVEFVPAQDLVIRKFRYALDWIFEKLRKKRRHL